MARRTTTYAIRLAVEGGGQVKAELVSLGQSGERLVALAERIELWAIDRLHPYERNPRTHSDAQVDQIAASMVEFGCAEGDTGKVYEGALPFEVARTSQLSRPATEIMVNLGNPELAFQTSLLPNDGVGLARMEFIIGEASKVHPMALVHPEKVGDDAEREQIERLTAGYPRPADYFVERLAEGVGTIAAAFYPRPVIVRMSDFKSNEYAALIGGRAFEPGEANPMLGFRGAARYAHPAYEEGFALECAAMRRVRETMASRT